MAVRYSEFETRRQAARKGALILAAGSAYATTLIEKEEEDVTHSSWEVVLNHWSSAAEPELVPATSGDVSIPQPCTPVAPIPACSEPRTKTPRLQGAAFHVVKESAIQHGGAVQRV